MGGPRSLGWSSSGAATACGTNSMMKGWASSESARIESPHYTRIAELRPEQPPQNRGDASWRSGLLPDLAQMVDVLNVLQIVECAERQGQSHGRKRQPPCASQRLFPVGGGEEQQNGWDQREHQ